jgi:hypothetical protein
MKLSTTSFFILLSTAAPSVVLAGDSTTASHSSSQDSSSSDIVDAIPVHFAGDSRKAPDLMGAVQVGQEGSRLENISFFANCDTKTQCTKYGSNSCATIYKDCNKQCKWNPNANNGKGLCEYNKPGPTPRSPTRRPTRRPTRKPSPSPPAPGSSICTWGAPDYDCYITGRPECCSYNGGRNCPNYMTMCNNYPADETGWDYCTNQPNYSCYPGTGQPACCNMKGGGTMNCPRQKPGCSRKSRFLRSSAAENN